MNFLTAFSVVVLIFSTLAAVEGTSLWDCMQQQKFGCPELAGAKMMACHGTASKSDCSSVKGMMTNKRCSGINDRVPLNPPEDLFNELVHRMGCPGVRGAQAATCHDNSKLADLCDTTTYRYKTRGCPSQPPLCNRK